MLSVYDAPRIKGMKDDKKPQDATSEHLGVRVGKDGKASGNVLKRKGGGLELGIHLFGESPGKGEEGETDATSEKNGPKSAG